MLLLVRMHVFFADYYNINGEFYDCFLYALYVNGAQPPGEDDGWGIGSSISRYSTVVQYYTCSGESNW